MENNYYGRFCIKPWYFIDISTKFKVFICCKHWVRKPIGNLKKKGAEKIWNSSKIKKIRASILDGSYKFCNKILCPEIQGNHLPKIDEAKKMESGKYTKIISNNFLEADFPPNYIDLCFDWTCNLCCPSCRHKHFFAAKKEIIIYEKVMNNIVRYITSQDKKHVIKLNLSGNGDPFASKVYRDFLFTFNGVNYPNIRICLQTNGVLFDKEAWDKMKKIHNNIDHIIISIDAGTKEVYDTVRLNGNWNKLIENLSFISELNKKGNFEFVRLDFLVQKNNFKDMPKFIEICKKFSFKPYFSRIIEWYKNLHIKNDMIIFSENSHEFRDFINTLKNPIFCWNEIDFGNVSIYMDLAIKELEKENNELFLKFIDCKNKKNIDIVQNQKNDKKEIWYNYRKYFVNKTDLISLFNTDVAKINDDILLKYDNTSREWIKCNPEEIEIYKSKID